jgi:fatty acid desaturase
LLLAVGWAAFALLGRSWWQMLVAVFLAVMFTQTGFIGHDAGHRQISGSKRADGLIGRIHGNLLIGLSYGWWVAKHNRHHAHPNQIGRDPDIGGRAIAALLASYAQVLRHLHTTGRTADPEPAAGTAAGPDAAPAPGHTKEDSLRPA